MGTIKEQWDDIAKPLDSLGLYEHYIEKIGTIQNTSHPTLSKSALLIFCSDNGIVEEGISQSGQEVTAICAKNIANKQSVAGIMAKHIHCDIKVYDVGMNIDYSIEQVQNCKIRKGTRNFLKEPALIQTELNQAIQLGKDIVSWCKQEGYSILCVGEMGIGNTTTSSAVAASLLKVAPETVTGKGAGLDEAGLQRKITVIDQAIQKYDLYNRNVYEILQNVSGYDIATMVGVYLGGLEYDVPVILDGAISLVAALAAYSIDENVTNVLIPSHASKEPLCELVCEKLKLTPTIYGQMALGEGTGALLQLQLLQTMLEVYENALRFENSGVEAYSRFGEES